MNFGRCHEYCLSTAADLKPGQTAFVAELGRGRCFRAKMLGLGVRPGVEMMIVNGHRRGPCIIEVNHHKVMLGREMLSGIILKGEEKQ